MLSSHSWLKWFCSLLSSNSAWSSATAKEVCRYLNIQELTWFIDLILLPVSLCSTLEELVVVNGKGSSSGSTWCTHTWWFTADKHILSLIPSVDSLWASSSISTMHVRSLGSCEDPTCGVIGEEVSPDIYAMSSPLKPLKMFSDY